MVRHRAIECPGKAPKTGADKNTKHQARKSEVSYGRTVKIERRAVKQNDGKTVKPGCTKFHGEAYSRKLGRQKGSCFDGRGRGRKSSFCFPKWLKYTQIPQKPSPSIAPLYYAEPDTDFIGGHREYWKINDLEEPPCGAARVVSGAPAKLMQKLLVRWGHVV